MNNLKLREKYIKEDVIGTGTYGTVYRARDKVTGDIFAIKRIIIDNFDDGIPASTIREIGLLLELDHYKHPNIVSMGFKKIYGISAAKFEVNATYEKSGAAFNLGEDGLKFCHQYQIIHRDIKPSNLLITKSGILKLADFGLARTNSISQRSHSHEIVTLWYRSPEIMLGATSYGTPIDIWSVGCITYEMVTGSVLFAGDSEIDQLFLIFRMFGTPSEKEWPGVTSFVDYKNEFPTFRPQSISNRMITKDLKEFILEMLKMNPYFRAEAHELRHAKFLRGAKIVSIE